MFAGLKGILFGSGSKSSKSLAKSRLQFVLVQDRTGLSAEELTSFKREMVGVIEKYFVIDEKGFDISYERAADLTTLVINSPVIVRRQDSTDMAAGARGKAARTQKRKQQAANAPVEATEPESTPA